MKKYYYISILPSVTYGIYMLRIIKKCGIFRKRYKVLDKYYSINSDIINNDDIVFSKSNIIAKIMCRLCDIVNNKKMRNNWRPYFPIHYQTDEMEENITVIDFKDLSCISSSISAKSIYNIIKDYERFKGCNIVDLNSLDKYTMLIDPIIQHTKSGEIIDTKLYAFNGTRYAKIFKENNTIARHNRVDINNYITEQIEDNIVLEECDKIDYAIIYGNAYFIK